MSIRHGHASSRYDRSPKSLAQQVGRATTSDKDGNVLTFTEVGTPERAGKLQAEGWGSFKPHSKTDCAIMWDKSEFSKLTQEVHRTTDKIWKDGNGHVHHQDCTTVVLEHKKSGRRLWLSLMHLPSDVQNGDEFKNNAKADAWKAAVRGWGDYHKQHKNDWHCDLTMYVADWNVDCRMQHWRDYINDLYPNCKGTWRKGELPADGTHGHRLIDATWTDGVFKNVMLLKDDDSSDHRPYGEVIGWP